MFCRLFSFIKTMFFCFAALWVGGFFYYLLSVTAYMEPTVENALTTDAIVVLTGGSDRLSTGIDLLAAEKGKRLLISGVNPSATLKQILAKKDVSQDLLDCCIDIDRASDSTASNVTETAKWMKEKEFASLRLVTSNYHMPRSLLLFDAQAPKIDVLPHPVISESVNVAQWWANMSTARLLINECNKYLYELVTIKLGL